MESIFSTPRQGYCGWPTLARTRGGDLLAACSGLRQRHICPYGRVLLFRSRDDGVTWEPPMRLSSGPLDDRDAGLLALPDGTLLVTWFTSLAWLKGITPGPWEGEWREILSPEEAQAWNEKRRSLSGTDWREALGCWSIRSCDGGTTWSAPVDSVVGNPHGPTLLSDGRLLLCGKRQAMDKLEQGENGSPFAGGLGVAQSSDGGASWQEVAGIPPLPGHDGSNYHEPHAVEAANGRIIMHIRNPHKLHAGEILQSTSDDGGYTWTPPRSLGLPGYPAHLLRLDDSLLLSTYSCRQPEAKRGIFAIVSCDHGETWSQPLTLARDVGIDFGYPSSAGGDRGEIFTLWYDRPDGAREAALRLKRWKLGEVAQ